MFAGVFGPFGDLFFPHLFGHFGEIAGVEVWHSVPAFEIAAIKDGAETFWWFGSGSRGGEEECGSGGGDGGEAEGHLGSPWGGGGQRWCEQNGLCRVGENNGRVLVRKRWTVFLPENSEENEVCFVSDLGIEGGAGEPKL